MSTHPYWIKIALVCAVFFALAGGVWFAVETIQQAANPRIASRTITTSGDGKILVVPDLATVSIGFSANQEDFSKVAAEASKTINNIIAAAKEQGVEDEYISQMQVSGGPGNVSGTINVTFEDPRENKGKLEAFLKKAIVGSSPGAGSSNTPPPNVQTYLNNICLSYENISEAQSEGREKALANAETKAAEFAAHAGRRLGKLTTMTDNSLVNNTYGGGYGNNCFGLSTLGTEHITEQPLFVNVTASFELR